jgi:predicted  nucleic acid-binding Zn-ribbon protein
MGTKNTPPETPVDLPAVPSLTEVRQLAQELEIQKDRSRNLNNQHEQAIEDLIVTRGLFNERLEVLKQTQTAIEQERQQLANNLVDAEAKLEVKCDAIINEYHARFRTLEAKAVSQADEVEARVDRAIAQLNLLRVGGSK